MSVGTLIAPLPADFLASIIVLQRQRQIAVASVMNDVLLMNRVILKLCLCLSANQCAWPTAALHTVVAGK
jgi:hypothetical protein